jgi:hypothetical protein
MQKIFAQFYSWFASRNIPTEGITITLQFRDGRVAEHFVFELNRDLSEALMFPMTEWDKRQGADKFQIYGIHAKIESPAHGAGNAAT